MTRHWAKQLEDVGAGDMEIVEPSSSDELSSKTNGSIVDSSLTAEEGMRLSASSSSESVTTVPPVSRVKEEPENLVSIQSNCSLGSIRGFDRGVYPFAHSTRVTH